MFVWEGGCRQSSKGRIASVVCVRANDDSVYLFRVRKVGSIVIVRVELRSEGTVEVDKRFTRGGLRNNEDLTTWGSAAKVGRVVSLRRETLEFGVGEDM